MSRLGDRFVLLREIGAGGMAMVFLGRDEVLDRPVAVKVLAPDLEDPDVAPRFRREGRTAAKLSHPNIVQVYDAGEGRLDGRQVSFIVMEYVPGGDLKGLMDRSGALPEAMLSRIGGDVAAGLAHAHERGVIHRDVKPRNILLDEHGGPKLTDFGIARAIDAPRATRTGSYPGTASYSSPEQLRGEKVTPKSDVYSFGATLYHAAVGEPPFLGEPLGVAQQQISESPVPPRRKGAAIGEGMESLILSCLNKDPEKRPDAARVRQRLLHRSAAGVGSAPARPGRWSSGRPGAVGEGVKAAGAAGAAGIARAAGAARSAGNSGAEAVRKRLARGAPAGSGPPEGATSLPTVTFRSGAQRRTAIAVLAAGILLVCLMAVGALALFGLNSGEQAGNSSDPTGGQRNQAEAPAPKKEADKATDGADGKDAANGGAQNPSGNAGSSGGNGSSGGDPEPDPGPPPPLAEAGQAVFELYEQEAYGGEGSWALLSSRLRKEVGSPQEWARQEGIETISSVYFPQGYPSATLSGEEAKVPLEVQVYRTTGTEIITGTWICVNEDGSWKLDRLENKQSRPY